MENFAELKTKKARKAHIKEMLTSCPQWQIRGLVVIFGFQTEDEKRIEATTHNNGVGFSGVDGEILSSFAKQVLNGRTLSVKQMALLAKRMPRYAGQLEGVAQ